MTRWTAKNDREIFFLNFFFKFFYFLIFIFRTFSGCFDTSGSMIPLSVSEIEGGYPERDEGTENGAGLVLKNSST